MLRQQVEVRKPTENADTASWIYRGWAEAATQGRDQKGSGDAAEAGLANLDPIEQGLRAPVPVRRVHAPAQPAHAVVAGLHLSVAKNDAQTREAQMLSRGSAEGRVEPGRVHCRMREEHST